VPKSQSLDAAQWNEYAQDRRFVLEWCSFFDSLPQPETMIVGERAADGTLISREVPTPQVKLAKAFEEGIARAQRSGLRSARAALRLGLQEVLDNVA